MELVGERPEGLFAPSALSEALTRLNQLLELRGIGLIIGEAGSELSGKSLKKGMLVIVAHIPLA